MKANKNVLLLTHFERWPQVPKDYASSRGFDESILSRGAVTYDAKKEELVWPFFSFKTGLPTDYRMRRTLSGARPRWLCPKGPVPVYWSPMFDTATWPEVAKDAREDIYIVESPAKALLLSSHSLNVIAGNGTYGLGSKNKGFKDELKLVKWKGRKVVLVPDSDHERNPDVRRAMKQLAEYFASEGANVFIKLLPTLAGHDKTGPDDFLAHKSGGIKKFLSLANHRHDDSQFSAWLVRPEIAEMNKKYAAIMVGNSFRVLIEPATKNDQPRLVRKHDFLNMYENKKIKVGEDDEGRPIMRAIAPMWLESEDRRQYDGLIFDPSDNAPKNFYNLWKGFAYAPCKGNWSYLRKHIHEVLANNNREHADWIINWLAEHIQNPAASMQTTLVLRGSEGVGKGIFVESVGALYGKHFVTVNKSEDLLGKFNQNLEHALLVFADEAFFAGDPRAADTLQSMITAETIRVERKGIDAYYVPNRLAYVMASNHDHVIKASSEARRYAVFDVSDKYIDNAEYFKRIKRQLEDGGYEAMLYDLLDYECKLRQKVPRTSAQAKQKILSLSTSEEFIFQSLVNKKIAGQAWSVKSRLKIERRVHTAEYEDFLARKGATYERRAAETKLGMARNRLLGPIEIERVQDQGERERCMLLPNLGVARERFEKAMKLSIDWATGEPEDTNE